MCWDRKVGFTCIHEFKQELACPDFQAGRKCHKVRQNTEKYYHDCPKCDPVTAVKESIPGIVLPKEVWTLLERTKRNMEREIERKASEPSDWTIPPPMISIPVENTQQAKRAPIHVRNDSASSQKSESGGRKKWWKLGRSNSNVDSPITMSPPTTPLERPTNARYSDTPSLANSRKLTTFIMPDENGKYHAPGTSADLDTGGVKWDTHPQGRMSTRSTHSSLTNGTATLSHDPRGRGSRNQPQHTRSLEEGTEETRRLQEMMRETFREQEFQEQEFQEQELQEQERLGTIVPRRISVQSPLRHESREWEPDVGIQNERGSELRSEDYGRYDTDPTSMPLTHEPRAMSGRTGTSSGTSPYVDQLFSRKPKVLQTCPPERERKQMVEARRLVENETYERNWRSSGDQVDQEQGIRPLVRGNGSDQWTDLSPKPLRISHHKKPSVDTVHENPVSAKSEKLPWEDCGVDYIENNHDASSVNPHSRTELLTKEEYLTDSCGVGLSWMTSEETGSSTDIARIEEWIESSVGYEELKSKEVPNLLITGGGVDVCHIEGSEPRLDISGEDILPAHMRERSGMGDLGDGDIARVRREWPKRGPLPKRKTPQQLNFVEALRRADERLKSVRDGRGYINYSSNKN